MAKFSEFMQHPRVAQWFNRQSGVADPVHPDASATNADSVAEMPIVEVAGVKVSGTEITGAENLGAKILGAEILGDGMARDDMLDAAKSDADNSNAGTTQDEIVAQTVTADRVTAVEVPSLAAKLVDDKVGDDKPAEQLAADNTPGGNTRGDKNADDHSADHNLDDEAEQYTDGAWEDALHVHPAPQRPLQRLLPMTARVGVLGLVAVVMWWTWPRTDDQPAWVNDARAGDIASFAVVNPANVEQTGAIARAATPATDAAQTTPASTAEFNNIVIVTPTSVPTVTPGQGTATLAEPIVLEASALVTDTDTDGDTGAIIIEIPEAVPVDSLMPALESEPSAVAQTEIILIPTATPTAQTVAAANNSIPKVEIVPAVGFKATPTATTFAVEPTPTETPTATPAPIGPGRLWSTFTPASPAENDHFWFGNPFENFSANRFSSPSYQFGSTAGNRYRPHHGLDFSNPSGTPVQAGVEGTVVHAGLDDPVLLGPYNNFYGNAVVIRLDQQLPVAGGELDVFLLYGHLSEVRVEAGQHVSATDVVGLVGMTGIAIGPHLHVEARLGANTYDHSVNPYLWLKPAEGNGAVAVRILTANGRTWAGAKVSIAQFVGGRAVWGRQIETYLDTENIGPDPNWGENGAMGDVPAGSYTLVANINGENIRANFEVKAGETTFVEIRTQQ